MSAAVPMIGFGFMDNMVMITMGICNFMCRASLSLPPPRPSPFQGLGFGLAQMQAFGGRVSELANWCRTQSLF